jgi:hypothetical protein
LDTRETKTRLLPLNYEACAPPGCTLIDRSAGEVCVVLPLPSIARKLIARGILVAVLSAITLNLLVETVSSSSGRQEPGLIIPLVFFAFLLAQDVYELVVLCRHAAQKRIIRSSAQGLSLENLDCDGQITLYKSFRIHSIELRKGLLRSHLVLKVHCYRWSKHIFIASGRREDLESAAAALREGLALPPSDAAHEVQP